MLHYGMDVESGSNIAEAQTLIMRYWPLFCVVDLQDPQGAVARVLSVMVIRRCSKVRDGLALKFGDGGESDSRGDVPEPDFAVGDGLEELAGK
jgi:hypothetical protein